MSNVKRLKITGRIPYNCAEHSAMQRYLGTLNSPSIGLKIEYAQAPFVRNDSLPTFDPEIAPANGSTSMFDFIISGEEAVSYPYIDSLLQAIVDCGGTIIKATAQDVQEGGEFKLPIPAFRKMLRLEDCTVGRRIIWNGKECEVVFRDLENIPDHQFITIFYLQNREYRLYRYQLRNESVYGK